MATEAVPPGLWEQIRSMIRDEVGKLLKSGLLRNASISDGGLTIKGGFLRLLYRTFNLFYVGPSGAPLGDGSLQQVIRMRRADGSMALQIHDAFPGADGSLNQAMTWFDRSGNAVFADDTDSGQGIARPWVPLIAYPAINTVWPAVTSTSFVTAHRAKGPKQQPRLFVEVWGWNDTAGATGEIQVLVNGDQLGSTQETGNGAVTGMTFGPGPVSGDHMGTITIEVQARRVAGSGSVQVGIQRIEGRQT